MIESVRFEKFKVLRDVELRGLQRLNVLVGPSGVGKTSVLEGLELLGRCLRSMRLSHVFWDSPIEARRMAVGAESYEISCTASSKWTMVLTLVRGDEAPSASVKFRSPQGEEVSGDYLDASTQAMMYVDESDGPPRGAIDELSHQALYQLDGRALGRPSEAVVAPNLARDGGGLASVLTLLASAYRDELGAIEDHLRKIVGVSGRIRTFPTELHVEDEETIKINDVPFTHKVKRTRLAHRFEVSIDEAGWIAGDLLSEGTLVALGLMAVLHMPNPPQIILLDDLDRGLHPSAQAALIRGLRAILESQPELQIIATSHSPYLLDNFQAEEVQVMTFTSEGQVAAARLDTHPEWLEWKGRLQTGEFWATVGEDWVGAKR